MGNEISYSARPEFKEIEMSNGLTSVFVSVTSLAMSSIAEEDWQRRFAAWFASHDQFAFGSGMVGFDVGCLPWSSSNLQDERAFVLRGIDAALTKTGWERLKYSPREESINECLTAFRKIIESFASEHICEDNSKVWALMDKPETFRLCSTHVVYKHDCGCPVCND